MPDFNFRRFLGLVESTTPKEPRADPTRQKAPPTRERDAAPIRLPSVDKKLEPVSEAAGEISTAKSKRAVESSRSRSGYVWVSQASRSKRASWADMPEKF